LRPTDRRRCRLDGKAKAIGRKRLFEIRTLVTPDTLFLLHRELIAKKYDGSKNRRSGGPRTEAHIEELVLLMARENPRGAIPGFAERSGTSVARSHATQSNGSFSIMDITRS
jgi:hypothetical protein